MPAPAQPFDVALGNPPFNLALEVIQHAMTMSSVVCMLLRINFLASQKRAAWMRRYTPSIYVLPKRPSFTGGKTDACEYAWFCWGLGSSHSNPLEGACNMGGLGLAADVCGQTDRNTRGDCRVCGKRTAAERRAKNAS